MIHDTANFAQKLTTMSKIIKSKNVSIGEIQSLGSVIPEQLAEETKYAYEKLREALGNDVEGFVANRLQFSPEELALALAQEQVDGIAFAIYNIEARGQSVIIGDQTGIGKGRQAAALIRYGMLAGYLPIFLTDRYTLFSDMYRDCKALGIKGSRPLILNLGATIVDFDIPVVEEEADQDDEIWDPNEDSKEEEVMELYTQQYEVVYKSPKKSELELMYRQGDIPTGCFEYVMLTYSQLKDAKRDTTRLDFLTSLCEKHRVLFIFDEAHKSSSVSAGKTSVITQGINSILEACPQTQCVFLSATFAKRPECLITFMRKTMLCSLANNEVLQKAFSNGGVQMQEYIASILTREGQMLRREHSNIGLPEPIYTYLEDKLELHSELFDKVMYYFRELINLSDMVKKFLSTAFLLGINAFNPYPTRAQLFYVNKILLLSLKANDVAEAAIREVQSGRSVVIGMSDTLECVLRDSIDVTSNLCKRGDFSTILLRLLDKTYSNPMDSEMTIFNIDLDSGENSIDLKVMLNDIRTYIQQIRTNIEEDVFHLPMSPIDIIRQLITQECFTDKNGITKNIRFEECTGRARQLEYLSPEGNDDYKNATVISRQKRHSNHIFNDFQNNKLDVILINACGAIGASAHAIATKEVEERDVRQRKMLIVQNDLDVNIDLQKRGRINRTGQLETLPPLYEYIITAIPSEKRLNMMLRAKLRSLSANTTANQNQDKKQADFIDITNKYGNLVAQEFIDSNPELAFIMGLNNTTTASQLLARIAMLCVDAQQEIIDEVFGAYQNLEQELRRINQWDIEREYRDFEAEFVRKELFSSPINDSILGGASMLSTFRCRHRTYPFDSLAIQQSIDQTKAIYGERLGNSDVLKKDITKYYRNETNKVREKIAYRKEMLFKSTLNTLLKYELESSNAKILIDEALRFNELSERKICKYIDDRKQIKRILSKLKNFQISYKDLNSREQKGIDILTKQKRMLLLILSNAVIGQGYFNILSYMPVEENINRVMAVLKEVRFDENPQKRFLPSKVQFVFALSAIHKELVLNLVDKGSPSNYNRLLGILTSTKWKFHHSIWDNEIAKYNNRILERKIITGNILGAFNNIYIQQQKLKPRFITFSLASNEGENTEVERGLLLPMSGGSVEKIMSVVSLWLADGLKYVTALNHVYQISGMGLGFSIIPTRNNNESELKFFISVNEKDSRKFESDNRFDAIRNFFKATPVTSIYNQHGKDAKNSLLHYKTERLSAQSTEFENIMTLLASYQAFIMIPREYLTIGEMKSYDHSNTADKNKNWPFLDWKKSSILPPLIQDMQVRISAPIIKDSNICYVDELPPHVLLCQRTLSYQNKSFSENNMFGQIRSLYFEWHDLHNELRQDSTHHLLSNFASKVTDEMHRLLVNSTKAPTIEIQDFIYKKMQEETNKYQLSAVGNIIAKYNKDMLFMSPSINIAEKFLDSCLCDPRLDNIRISLENYISGKTEIITNV